MKRRVRWDNIILLALEAIKWAIVLGFTSWILFSWGEVAHKQVNHDYELSENNFFELINKEA